MMKKTSLILLGVLFLSACAHVPPQKSSHARRVRKFARTPIGSEIRHELSSLLAKHQRPFRDVAKRTAPALGRLTNAVNNMNGFEAKDIVAIPELGDRTEALDIDSEFPISDDQNAHENADARDERIPLLVNPEFVGRDLDSDRSAEITVLPSGPLRKLDNFSGTEIQLSPPSEAPLIFELPVTYNDRVKGWVEYFQNQGRATFKRWLERSTRWIPFIRAELEAAELPQDLVYVAMIESGFSNAASSPASAVGMWQFIRSTANRYGLKTTWWLDERRDFEKSTKAAIRYLKDLYRLFGSWYLVAAGYNMGESGVQRRMKKHKSSDYWELADLDALPKETRNYVPKIIAAMLIAKAPALYGFRDLQYSVPFSFDVYFVPGGTDLYNLAAYLGVSGKYLHDLNPELIKGFVPQGVRGHRIRIPKGAMATVAQYVKMQGAVATN